MKVLVGLLLVAFALANAEELQTSLKGSKVYNVYPKTDSQYEFLSGLEEVIDGLDFWQRANRLGREGRVMVPEESLQIFESMLQDNFISYTIEIEDVFSTLEKANQKNKAARLSSSSKDSMISLNVFNRHYEINSYLDALALKYPTKCKVRTLGKSGQGRDLKAIFISTTGGNDTTKPAIIIEAGIHAREWIAPAFSLYLISKLIEQVSDSDIVEKIDWVIIPVLNPDGYEYSHSSTNNRLWRKTRSITSNETCPGVDGNRNFDFHWMESGTSDNPCVNSYGGPKAFSEPETRHVRDLIEEYQGKAKGYLSMHSYGSYFLYPYGYNGEPTPDDAMLHELGLKIAAAIDNASLPGSDKYLVGNSGAALEYLASGSSDDYAYSKGIKVSYTIELPGGGRDGWDPPPSMINQIATESYEGILVMARHVYSNN